MTQLFHLLLFASMTWNSPINYEISLAGNFGEPRPNHFHAGIDIKTGGVEGKPLFSIGDGYVSHVSIGESGYGNAIYVKHPEGYTSVYCHLKTFPPHVMRRIKRWQYLQKKQNGTITFSPTDLPVTRGMLIAISGNSGSSTAPHLHLEIRDDYTGEFCDPLMFLGQYIKDGVAPVAHGFMANPKRGEGRFENSFTKQTFVFSANNVSRVFTAWGKVGFALWANDYMEQSYNHFGIKRTELFVNDSLYFVSDVDRIPYWGSILVNSLGDNVHFRQSGVWYMRSYQHPGSKLPFITTHYGDGYVNFNEEKEYRIKYVLTDYWNNSSTYQFRVLGKPESYEALKPIRLNRLIAWDKPTIFQFSGLQLVVPPHSIEDKLELKPIVSFQNNQLSPSYSLYSSPYLLFSPAKLSIQLRKSVKDVSKLYIQQDGIYPLYRGGRYKSGWVIADIKDIGGKYQIAYDDVSPTISLLSKREEHMLRFSIIDKGSGLAAIEAYVDHQFVLLENKEKTAFFYCNLEKTPLVRMGRNRKLVVIAKDNRGNRQEFKTNIQY